MSYKRRSGATIAAFAFFTLLACTFSVGEMNISLGPPSPTPTNTRTPRPTITVIPSPTETSTPTDTPTPSPTATATRRPATPRPPTPRPPTAGPPPTAAPPVSTYEFHANPPLPCAHSGRAFLKGTVYLNRSDPNSKYVGAIVALGPPNASTMYGDPVKTDDYGEYTFVLGGEGEAKPGYYGIWLVDPSYKRKSDIGGPIVLNNLPADNPSSCWTSGVDFWK